METIEALQKIKDCIENKRREVLNEIDFCTSHNFTLEAEALRYKVKAYAEIKNEILYLLDDIKGNMKRA